MAACYRHPDQETGVSCSSCGNPICPACMTPTPVGMRCPDCAGQKTKVRTAANLSGTSAPQVTTFIIASCVVLFLAGYGGSGRLEGMLALRGIPEISSLHEYWRLASSGFLHAGWLHLGLNMYLLWVLGRDFEMGVGSRHFAAIYVVALLWGAMGGLGQTTLAPIVGASGAVFGVVGGMMVELRRRGMDPFSGGLGGLVVLNLIIGFLPGFHIAWGGHIGGFIGGALAASALGFAASRRSPALGYGLCVLLGIVAVAGSIAVSGNAHDFSF